MQTLFCTSLCAKSMSQLPAPQPDLHKEVALWKQGYRWVAGLDEAGRGAWAGPVVAAAVILPLDDSKLTERLAGLNDSKLLTPRQREQLFGKIQAVALATAVGLAPAAIVDELNVVQATRYAMQQALTKLDQSPDYLLIDHLSLPAIDLPQLAFPKADRLSLSVAAASVVAKVTRDRLMIQLSEQYPDYAFERHKGYGTSAHRAALNKKGPCRLHRLSYGPLKTLPNN